MKDPATYLCAALRPPSNTSGFGSRKDNSRACRWCRWCQALCVQGAAQITLARRLLIYSGLFWTLHTLSFIFINISIYKNVCRQPWAATEPETGREEWRNADPTADCSVTRGSLVFAIYCTCPRFIFTSRQVHGCSQPCRPWERPEVTPQGRAAERQPGESSETAFS